MLHLDTSIIIALVVAGRLSSQVQHFLDKNSRGER